jgi:hypothetical protein
MENIASTVHGRSAFTFGRSLIIDSPNDSHIVPTTPRVRPLSNRIYKRPSSVALER